MMRPISNRNGLVRDLITLTFGAKYVLKQNIVRKNDILLILPVNKLLCYRVFGIVTYVTILTTSYYVTIVRLTAWPICGDIMHFSQ